MKQLFFLIVVFFICSFSLQAQSDKSLYDAGRQNDNHVFEKKDSVNGAVLVTYTLPDVYDDDRETYVVADTFELQALPDPDEEDTGVTALGDIYVYRSGKWELHYNAYKYAANCCEDIYHTEMYVEGDSIYLVSDNGGDTLTAPIYNPQADSTIKVTSIDVTGTDTKTFTLIQSNGDTLTTNWLDLSETDTTGNATADLDSIQSVTFNNVTRILTLENKNFDELTTEIPDSIIKVTELYFESDTSLYLIQSNGDTLVASYINDTTDIIVNNGLHYHGDTSIHLGGILIEQTLLETKRYDFEIEKISLNNDSLYFKATESNRNSDNAIVLSSVEKAATDSRIELGVDEHAKFYGYVENDDDRYGYWNYDEWNFNKRVGKDLRYNNQDFTSDGVVGLIIQNNNPERKTEYKFEEANGIFLLNQLDNFNSSSISLDDGNVNVLIDNDLTIETRDYQNLETEQWDVLTRTQANSAVTDFVPIQTILDTLGIEDSVVIVTDIEISGSNTKTITLIQSNGDTLTDTFTDLTGGGGGDADLDSIKIVSFDNVTRTLTLTNIADDELSTTIPDSFWNVIVNNGLHFHGDTSIHLGGDLIEDTEIRTNSYIVDFKKISPNDDTIYFGLVESNDINSERSARFYVQSNDVNNTKLEAGVDEDAEQFARIENSNGNILNQKKTALEWLMDIDDSNENHRTQITKSKFLSEINNIPANNVRSYIENDDINGISIYNSSDNTLDQVTKVELNDGDLLISSNDKLLVETKKYLDGNTSQYYILARKNDVDAEVEYFPMEELMDSIPIIDSFYTIVSSNVTGDSIKTLTIIQENHEGVQDTFETSWTDIASRDSTGNTDLNDYLISHTVTGTGNTRTLTSGVLNQSDVTETFNVEDNDSDPNNESQTLSVNSTAIDDVISISSENSITIDDDLGEVTNVTVTGTTTKTIEIENSTGTTVTDTWTDLEGTDDQNISGSNLTGTTLFIGIENGTGQNVDLSNLRDFYELTSASGLTDGRIRFTEQDQDAVNSLTYLNGTLSFPEFESKTDAEANGTLVNGGFWRAGTDNKLGTAPSTLFLKEGTTEVDAGAGSCHDTGDPSGFIPGPNECRTWVNTTTGDRWCFNDFNNTWENCSGEDDTNFAQNDLTFNANRLHNVAGFDLTLDNIDQLIFRSDESTAVDYFNATNIQTYIKQGANTEVFLDNTNLNLTTGSDDIGLQINSNIGAEKVVLRTQRYVDASAEAGSMVQLINRDAIDQIEYSSYEFRTDDPPSGDYYQTWNNGNPTWTQVPTISVEKYLSGFNITNNTPGNTIRTLTGIVENSTNPTVNIDPRDGDYDDENEFQTLSVEDVVGDVSANIVISDLTTNNKVTFNSYDGIELDGVAGFSTIDISINQDSIQQWQANDFVESWSVSGSAGQPTRTVTAIIPNQPDPPFTINIEDDDADPTNELEREKDYCTPSSTANEVRVLNERVCKDAVEICVDVWIEKPGTYPTYQFTLEHNSDDIPDKQRNIVSGSTITVPSGGAIVHTECYNVNGTLETNENIEFELTNATLIIQFGNITFTNVCYGNIEVENCGSSGGSDDQTISTDGTAGDISIEDGNNLTLNVDDADADPNNEVQDFSISTLAGNQGGNLSDVRLGLTPISLSRNCDYRGIGLDVQVVSPGDVIQFEIPSDSVTVWNEKDGNGMFDDVNQFGTWQVNDFTTFGEQTDMRLGSDYHVHLDGQAWVFDVTDQPGVDDVIEYHDGAVSQPGYLHYGTLDESANTGFRDVKVHAEIQVKGTGYTSNRKTVLRYGDYNEAYVDLGTDNKDVIATVKDQHFDIQDDQLTCAIENEIYLWPSNSSTTIFLPPAADFYNNSTYSNQSKVITIKNGGTGTQTIEAQAGENIDGAATYSLGAWESVDIFWHDGQFYTK